MLYKFYRTGNPMAKENKLIKFYHAFQIRQPQQDFNKSMFTSLFTMNLSEQQI